MPVCACVCVCGCVCVREREREREKSSREKQRRGAPRNAATELGDALSVGYGEDPDHSASAGGGGQARAECVERERGQRVLVRVDRALLPLPVRTHALVALHANTLANACDL